jgi:hypothetical protein
VFQKFQNGEKGTNDYSGRNKIFKSRSGFLKMDIFKMSKIENLNKVSKNKSDFLKCDDNALKNNFLLKKCVTITFSQSFGTKSGIQLFHF